MLGFIGERVHDTRQRLKKRLTQGRLQDFGPHNNPTTCHEAYGSYPSKDFRVIILSF